MNPYFWDNISRLNALQSEMTYLESLQQQEWRRKQIAHENRRARLHIGAEILCKITKKRMPEFGLLCGFIGCQTAGNFVEAFTAALDTAECAYKRYSVHSDRKKL